MQLRLELIPSPLPGNPQPRYPEDLRAAALSQERADTVRVRVRVDTTGLVDMSTFAVVGNPDPRFVAAVREALPLWRFRPAEEADEEVRGCIRANGVDNCALKVFHRYAVLTEFAVVLRP